MAPPKRPNPMFRLRLGGGRLPLLLLAGLLLWAAAFAFAPTASAWVVNGGRVKGSGGGVNRAVRARSRMPPLMAAAGAGGKPG